MKVNRNVHAVVDGLTIGVNTLTAKTGCTQRSAATRICDYNSGKITQEQLLESKKRKKLKKYDIGGQLLTVAEVAKIASISERTASSRICRFLSSGNRHPERVLAKVNLRKHAPGRDVAKTYTDGTHTYKVDDIVSVVGISRSAASDRLRKWMWGRISHESLFSGSVEKKISSPTKEWLELGNETRNSHLLCNGRPTKYDRKFVNVYDPGPRNCPV